MRRCSHGIQRRLRRERRLRRGLWRGALCMFLMSLVSRSVVAEVEVNLDSEQQSQLLQEAVGAYRHGLKAADEGDVATARQAFERSAEKFQVLVDSGISNGPLFFDLGNACWQAGRLGRAIAGYRQALAWMPGDPTVRANLRFARNQLARRHQVGPIDAGSTDSAWQALVAFNARWCWALLAPLGIVGWWIVWCGWRLNKSRWHRAALPMLVVGLALALTGAASWTVDWMQRPSGLQAVVLRETQLRDGNGRAFEPKYDQALPEGAECDVLQTRGQWAVLRTSDGRTGWVARETIIELAEGR